jgi:hypothetical protein
VEVLVVPYVLSGGMTFPPEFLGIGFSCLGCCRFELLGSRSVGLVLRSVTHGAIWAILDFGVGEKHGTVTIFFKVI